MRDALHTEEVVAGEASEFTLKEIFVAYLTSLHIMTTCEVQNLCFVDVYIIEFYWLSIFARKFFKTLFTK